MLIAIGVTINAGAMGQSQAEPDPFAPYNLELPTISGEPFEGSLFSCNPGRWAGIPTATIAYQWKRDGVNIGGATSSTYLASGSDIGTSLSCLVTATNAEGSSSEESQLIGPIEPQASVPFNDVIPSIIGSPLTGSLLAVVPGSWTAYPAPTFTYQWLADGVPIEGATDPTYQLTNEEVGHAISVTETATNIGGSASATSDETIAISDPNPPYAPFVVQAPVVSGLLIIGSTLTCSEGTWDAIPEATFSYQWLADGFLIFAETTNSYVVQNSDQGKRISCRVTAVNEVGATPYDAVSSANIGRGIAITKRYVRKVSYGTGDGSSWDNAAALSTINTRIAAAGAYGEVLVRADEGTYTASLINLTAGGPVGQPVIVRGCDVNERAMNAVIVGSRTDPWVPGGTNGPEVFRMMAGVHDLVFRNIEFRRCGNGCFRVGDNIDNLTIEQCVADNVMRFIECGITGTAVTANLTNSTFRHCRAYGFGRAFLRLQYDCSNILVEDCFGDAEQQDGQAFGSCCVISDTVHDMIYRRCTMKNPLDTKAGDELLYWNGDCYSQENGNYNIQYIDCVAKGASDGGFDCKGACTFLRCLSEENKKNFRLWGTAVLTDCISRDCFIRGGNSEASIISLHSVDADITLNNFVICDVRAASTIFLIDEATAVLTVNSGSLQYDAGATLVDNPNSAPFDISALETPPANTVQPVVSGTETAGSVLAVTTGTWDDPDVQYTYQWCRDGLYIDDATNAIYMLGALDVGAIITCRVYATADATGYMGEVVSTATSAIDALAPSNVVQPSITGVAAVGGILSVNNGTWDGLPAPTFTYQWERDTGSGPVDISGETAATYTLVLADQGNVITVNVTGTNGAGTDSARSTPTAEIGAALTVLYVGPSAVGTKDGSSFANAIALSGLANAFPTVAAGGEVLIRADAGSYNFTSSINLSHGGTAGNPITIRGCNVDEEPMKALIIGSRTNWVLPSNPEQVSSVGSWSVGNDIFRLNAGADYLTFQELSFKNVGKCWNGALAVVHDIICEDWEVYNCQEGFFTNSFSLYNMTFRRFKAIGFSKRVIRMFADAHDWLMEDFELNSGRQDRDDFAGGIILNDTAHDAIIRGYIADGSGNNIGLYSGIVENCHDTTSDYWNGDGVGGERGNYNVLVENVISRGHTDAGIDTKGTNWTIRNFVAYDNKKNYRLWGYNDVVVEDCVSRDPFKRGGSSSTAHYMIIGPSDPNGGTLVDMTFKQCVAELTPGATGNASAWTMLDDNIYNTILRNISNTFINTNDNNLPASGNSIKVAGSVGDNIDPVNTTSTPNNAYKKQSVQLTLSANEDVIWSKVSGDSNIKLIDSAGREVPVARYLKFAATDYAPGGDNNYQIVLTMEDALGNTQNVTIQFNVINATPPMVFHSTFEGVDLQTTPITDLATGKTITFANGGKLTATDPLEGSTSLLLSGGTTQSAIVSHSDDFWFENDAYSIIALIRPTTSFANFGTICGHGTSSDDTRSFRLGITTAGALDFFWSINGKDTTNVRSADGLIALNTTYEVAVDRDESNQVRIYIDGVMVDSEIGSGTLKNPTGDFRIGRSSTTTEGFRGRIDDLKVWKNYSFCGSDAGYTP